MIPIRIFICFFAALFCANQTLFAQFKLTQDTEKTSTFIVRAAKPPYAALKYRLLPRYSEQTPGNAAPHYMRAALAWEGDGAYQAAKEKIGDWAELPLTELKANAEANTFFNTVATGKWELIQLAAQKEQCDWDLPLRQNHFATHIPELQKMQSLGQLIAFKARMEMARGQLDLALETLKTGFALARHVGNGQTLVNGLVGIAIAGEMVGQLETLVQQPNCPNLLWTLSNLPDPLVDLRPGLEMEQDSIYFAFPELRDVRTAKHTASKWDALLVNLTKRVMTLIPQVTGGADAQKDSGWWAAAGFSALAAYPKAVVQLREAGYSLEKISAMPASQAILLAVVETYDKQRDDIHKWYYLPIASYAGDRIDLAIGDIRSSNEIVPLAKLLFPSIGSIKSTDLRLQRELAALRVFEALRFHLAEHGNKLPQRLSDIDEVPVPLDPVTGKAFEYSVDKNVATLKSPAPFNGGAHWALHWQLEMAAAK